MGAVDYRNYAELMLLVSLLNHAARDAGVPSIEQQAADALTGAVLA